MLGAALALSFAACSHGTIPNTDVDDTPQNRELIEFVEKYRRAIEARDAPAIIAMAAEQYYDDNGTPSGSDDVDQARLRDQLVAWVKRVRDVRYEMRYRDIRADGKRIYVEYTYTGSFLIALKDGEQWRRRIGDNRLTLVRDSSHRAGYRILAGL